MRRCAVTIVVQTQMASIYILARMFLWSTCYLVQVFMNCFNITILTLTLNIFLFSLSDYNANRYNTIECGDDHVTILAGKLRHNRFVILRMLLLFVIKFPPPVFNLNLLLTQVSSYAQCDSSTQHSRSRHGIGHRELYFWWSV